MKKLISLLLAVVMVISCLPGLTLAAVTTGQDSSSAFEVRNEQNEVVGYTDDGADLATMVTGHGFTVKLLKDHTAVAVNNDGYIDVDYAVTLDLNNKTLDAGTGRALRVADASATAWENTSAYKTTIKNGVIVGSGSAILVMMMDGQLDMQNVGIYNTSSGSGCAASMGARSGDATITNSELYTTSGNVFGCSSGYAGTVTMENCSLFNGSSNVFANGSTAKPKLVLKNTATYCTNTQQFAFNVSYWTLDDTNSGAVRISFGDVNQNALNAGATADYSSTIASGYTVENKAVWYAGTLAGAMEIAAKAEKTTYTMALAGNVTENADVEDVITLTQGSYAATGTLTLKTSGATITSDKALTVAADVQDYALSANSGEQADGTYKYWLDAANAKAEVWAAGAAEATGKFATLAEAAAAAAAGQTVKLLDSFSEDVTVTASGVIFDLNGNSYTGTISLSDAGSVVYNAALEGKVNAETLVKQDGVNAYWALYESSAALVQATGTEVVLQKDTTVTRSDADIFKAYGNFTIDLNNKTLTMANGGRVLAVNDGQGTNLTSNVVNLKNGSIVVKKGTAASVQISIMVMDGALNMEKITMTSESAVVQFAATAAPDAANNNYVFTAKNCDLTGTFGFYTSSGASAATLPISLESTKIAGTTNAISERLTSHGVTVDVKAGTDGVTIVNGLAADAAMGTIDAAAKVEPDTATVHYGTVASALKTAEGKGAITVTMLKASAENVTVKNADVTIADTNNYFTGTITVAADASLQGISEALVIAAAKTDTNVYYGDVSKAIENATASVTLLSNQNKVEVGKSVTLNLNGKTVSEVSITNAAATLTVEGDVNVTSGVTGYVVAKNGNVYTLSASTETVEIGGTGYATLDAALDAAAIADAPVTIKLLTDNTETGLALEAGTVTIDLNGHTMSGSIAVSGTGVLTKTEGVAATADVTVTNGQTVVYTAALNATSLAAADCSTVIDVLRDIEETSITGSVGVFQSKYGFTLKLNGKTVKSSARAVGVSDGLGTNAVDYLTKVIGPGTLKTSTSQGFMMMDGSLELDGVTVELTSYTGAAIQFANTAAVGTSSDYVLTVKNSSITGTYAAVSNSSNGTPAITAYIENSTLTATAGIPIRPATKNWEVTFGTGVTLKGQTNRAMSSMVEVSFANDVAVEVKNETVTGSALTEQTRYFGTVAQAEAKMADGDIVVLLKNDANISVGKNVTLEVGKLTKGSVSANYDLTATVNEEAYTGTVIMTDAAKTITASEALKDNIASGVAGKAVKYTDGVYSLADGVSVTLQKGTGVKTASIEGVAEVGGTYSLILGEKYNIVAEAEQYYDLVSGTGEITADAATTSYTVTAQRQTTTVTKGTTVGAEVTVPSTVNLGEAFEIEVVFDTQNYSTHKVFVGDTEVVAEGGKYYYTPTTKDALTVTTTAISNAADITTLTIDAPAGVAVSVDNAAAVSGAVVEQGSHTVTVEVTPAEGWAKEDYTVTINGTVGTSATIDTTGKTTETITITAELAKAKIVYGEMKNAAVDVAEGKTDAGQSLTITATSENFDGPIVKVDGVGTEGTYTIANVEAGKTYTVSAYAAVAEITVTGQTDPILCYDNVEMETALQTYGMDGKAKVKMLGNYVLNGDGFLFYVPAFELDLNGYEVGSVTNNAIIIGESGTTISNFVAAASGMPVTKIVDSSEGKTGILRGGLHGVRSYYGALVFDGVTAIAPSHTYFLDYRADGDWNANNKILNSKLYSLSSYPVAYGGNIGSTTNTAQGGNNMHVYVEYSTIAAVLTSGTGMLPISYDGMPVGASLTLGEGVDMYTMRTTYKSTSVALSAASKTPENVGKASIVNAALEINSSGLNHFSTEGALAEVTNGTATVKASTPAEIANAINADGTTVVKMLKDYTGGEFLVTVPSFTLDLNGKTVKTTTGAAVSVSTAGTTNTVTTVKNGTIIAGGNAVDIQAGSVKISNVSLSSGTSATVVISSATTDNIIENSTLYTTSANYGTLLVTQSAAKVTVTDCVLAETGDYSEVIYGNGTVALSVGTTVYGNSQAVSASVTITPYLVQESIDATFESAALGVTVSGLNKWVAKTEMPPIAEVTNTSGTINATTADQIEAAINADGTTTVKLLADYIGTSFLNDVPSFTLDLNGKTVEVSGAAAISVTSAGTSNTVTTVKNGTIKTAADAISVTAGEIILDAVNIHASEGSALVMDQAGAVASLVRDSVLYGKHAVTVTAGAVSAENTTLVSIDETALAVTGSGTVTLGANVDVFTKTADYKDANVTVNGTAAFQSEFATYENTDLELDLVRMNYWTTRTENIPSFPELTQIAEMTYTGYNGTYKVYEVAEIKDVLLSKGTDGKATLKLVDDITVTGDFLTGVPSFTFDLNGHTVKASGLGLRVTAAGTEVSKTVVKNGTIDTTNHAVRIDAGTVEIQNMTLHTTGAPQHALFLNNANTQENKVTRSTLVSSNAIALAWGKSSVTLAIDNSTIASPNLSGTGNLPLSYNASGTPTGCIVEMGTGVDLYTNMGRTTYKFSSLTKQGAVLYEAEENATFQNTELGINVTGLRRFSTVVSPLAEVTNGGNTVTVYDHTELKERLSVTGNSQVKILKNFVVDGASFLNGVPSFTLDLNGFRVGSSTNNAVNVGSAGTSSGLMTVKNGTLVGLTHTVRLYHGALLVENATIIANVAPLCFSQVAAATNVIRNSTIIAGSKDGQYGNAAIAFRNDGGAAMDYVMVEISDTTLVSTLPSGVDVINIYVSTQTRGGNVDLGENVHIYTFNNTFLNNSCKAYGLTAENKGTASYTENGYNVSGLNHWATGTVTGGGSGSGSGSGSGGAPTTFPGVAGSGTSSGTTTETEYKQIFVDVPKTYWGMEAIHAAANAGLVKGKKITASGHAYYMPEDAMTRAEFVTTMVRFFYADEAALVDQTAGAKWWTGYYELALKKGLVKSGELDGGDMDKAMSREEMALVIYRAAARLAAFYNSKPTAANSIPDYAAVGADYKDAVLWVYGAGIIQGMNEAGQFMPKNSLTRAQVATILHNLIVAKNG